MSAVDELQASNRARELADESVKNIFHPRDRQSMAAQFHWAKEFKRQFNAYTKPEPERLDHQEGGKS